VKKVDTGKHGESIAVRHLEQNGYRILERNVYSRVGEIDIVACIRNTYHFVEVKTRLNCEYGCALESITHKKLNRIQRTVEGYLNKNRLKDICISIDLIAIDINVDGVVNVEWVKNISMV